MASLLSRYANSNALSKATEDVKEFLPCFFANARERAFMKSILSDDIGIRWKNDFVSDDNAKNALEINIVAFSRKNLPNP